MVDTQLLEDAIKRSGIKKSHLADKLGISVQSLRLKVKGKSDFKSNEALLMCQELGINCLSDMEKIFLKM